MQIETMQPAGDCGLIMTLDGLIDESKCFNFIEKLKTVWDKSHLGKTLGGVNIESKTTEDIHVSEFAFRELGIAWDESWYSLEMHFADALISAVSIYKQNYRHLDSWIQVADTGFQVQKYSKNFGFYRPHVDSFPVLNSSINNRVLGCVIYLNDVEYGGETNFPLHSVKVKPKAGRIALFPASWTHPHESCVPITDDKWIISTFIVNDQWSNGQPPSHPDDHTNNDSDDNVHTHHENTNDF